VAIRYHGDLNNTLHSHPLSLSLSLFCVLSPVLTIII
jgi:hypothetical protein